MHLLLKVIDNAERHKVYQDLFRYELDVNVVGDIRHAALFSIPTGDSRFKEQVEMMHNRKLGYAKRGGPLKAREAGSE